MTVEKSSFVLLSHYSTSDLKNSEETQKALRILSEKKDQEEHPEEASDGSSATNHTSSREHWRRDAWLSFCWTTTQNQEVFSTQTLPKVMGPAATTGFKQLIGRSNDTHWFLLECIFRYTGDLLSLTFLLTANCLQGLEKSARQGWLRRRWGTLCGSCGTLSKRAHGAEVP